ncbi:signal peptidase II [bacterium]|nr:signal peptidase II [bacterium]
MSGEAGEENLMSLLLLAAIVLILDQISKFIICRIILPGGSFPVIENVFYLTHVQNKGAAFGLFPNQTLFFIIVTLFTILLILFFHQRISKEGSSPSWALGLILGGALGNLIDRIRLKAVIDFLDFSLKGYHWPSFNIADSAITIGAVILFISLFRKK